MQTFSSYNAGNKDALEYQAKLTFFTLAIYGCFAAYVMGWMSVWWMSAVVSVLVTRWMIAFHELFHLKKAEELDLLSRIGPIPFAPLNLGYREYRHSHFGHHHHTASAMDPDAFHIRGGFLKAFIGAATQHEQATYRYISTHGLSRELASMMLIRLTLFTTILLVSPSAFLVWWLVLRVTYTINEFIFFHIVHYRAGLTGTFPLPLPAMIRYLALLIYGVDVVYATMHHDIHHMYPKVAAKYLPVIANNRVTS